MENLEKSLNERLEKARATKYDKRTGGPGNYKYWYYNKQTGKYTTNRAEAMGSKKKTIKEGRSERKADMIKYLSSKGVYTEKQLDSMSPQRLRKIYTTAKTDDMKTSTKKKKTSKQLGATKEKTSYETGRKLKESDIPKFANRLKKWPLKKLRQHQEINKKQSQDIYHFYMKNRDNWQNDIGAEVAKNKLAAHNLDIMEKVYIQAIDRKEFPDEYKKKKEETTPAAKKAHNFFTSTFGNKKQFTSRTGKNKGFRMKDNSIALSYDAQKSGSPGISTMKVREDGKVEVVNYELTDKEMSKKKDPYAVGVENFIQGSKRMGTMIMDLQNIEYNTNRWKNE